jgi:hypothetical protein
MVALREEWSEKHRAEQGPGPEAEGARWMSLRRAACHLDVCTSTLRRRMRKGQLPWRVVNHGPRWSYEVLVPAGLTPCDEQAQAQEGVVSIGVYLHDRLEETEEETTRLTREVEHLEQMIENLSQALARARAGNHHKPEDSPYAKYRQLALRRRWWPF